MSKESMIGWQDKTIERAESIIVVRTLQYQSLKQSEDVQHFADVVCHVLATTAQLSASFANSDRLIEEKYG